MSGKINMEELLSYGDDLITLLKDQKDIHNFNQCLEYVKALRSSCDDDFSNFHSLIQDYEKKIDASLQRTDEAKLETVPDAELDVLEKDLEDELLKERLLMEEIRVVTNEINELDQHWISVQERKQALKKLEQEELKSQRKLSMYASVTDIIPDMEAQSKISGHIVDRNKRVMQKFEFDPTKMSSFDTCNSIWDMIYS